VVDREDGSRAEARLFARQQLDPVQYDTLGQVNLFGLQRLAAGRRCARLVPNDRREFTANGPIGRWWRRHRCSRGTVGRRSVAVVLLFLLGWRVFGFVVTGWDSG
jgi:hypothetical protein